MSDFNGNSNNHGNSNHGNSNHGNSNFGTSVRSILVLAFGKEIASDMNLKLRLGGQLAPKTEEQKAICQAAMRRERNIVVNALAGTGKSTTIRHIAECFPMAKVEASTVHSTGFRALSYYLRQKGVPAPEIQQDKVKVILKGLTGYDSMLPDDQVKADNKIIPANSLVRFMKNLGYGGAVHGTATDDDMDDICDKYDIELPDPTETGISATEVYDLARQTLDRSNREVSIIDFEDMIYLPLLLKVSFYHHDLIMIDESQDLNPTRIAMIRQMSRSTNPRYPMNSQVCFVGDRNQAIFGFTGADTEAIESIVKLFDCIELPLSVCWRCPVDVIAEAQKIVPQIQAAPNAIQGEVKTYATHKQMMDEAESGDFVLCRTTAPLVDVCMQFIRAGKAATVRGRDIGQGLIQLADKIRRKRSNKGKSIVDAIENYRTEQLAKLDHPSKENQRQSLNDKIDTISILSEDCETWDCIKKKIENIFKDATPDNGMIVCSTAHKAKGLEAERVYIVHPELMPFPYAKKDWQIKQEYNLLYVARTRAT